MSWAGRRVQQALHFAGDVVKANGDIIAGDLQRWPVKKKVLDLVDGWPLASCRFSRHHPFAYCPVDTLQMEGGLA
jgi:hypothetical protein